MGIWVNGIRYEVTNEAELLAFCAGFTASRAA